MMEILTRINELSRKRRSGEELSAAEQTEHESLRQQYLQMIRGQLRTTLLSVSVVDAEGTDVTPQRLAQDKVQAERSSMS